MTIAVTTPTGNVGAHLVRSLLRAGERPRVLVRDAATLRADLHGLVDVVEVDQGDADGVVDATAGVEALFWVNPPTADDDPIAAHLRAGRIAARAVRTHRLPRTVFLSSGGAELRNGAGEIDGLGGTEDLLDAAVSATGTSLAHLRCGFFFTNVLPDLPAMRDEGVWRTPWPPGAAMPWVAPRDIAEVAAGRLLSRAWSGRVVQAVHGPEDMTFARAAVLIGRTIGRDVRVEHLDHDTFRQVLRSAGLPEGQVAAIARDVRRPVPRLRARRRAQRPDHDAHHTRRVARHRARPARAGDLATPMEVGDAAGDDTPDR